MGIFKNPSSSSGYPNTLGELLSRKDEYTLRKRNDEEARKEAEKNEQLAELEEAKLPFYKRPFYKKHIKPKILFIVDRNRWFNKMWMLMIFCIELYNSFLIPYRSAFDYENSMYWYLADAPFDFLLWVDVVMNFFYPYRDQMNILVTDFKKTARRYVFKEKIGFFADFVCLCLLDWIPVAIGAATNGSMTYSPVWRLNRALFFFRALKRLTRIEALVPDRFAVLSKMVKLLNFVIIVVMSVHIVACCWFPIIMSEYPDSQVFTLSASIFEPTTSTLYKYMLGVYWSLVSMSGFGGTMPVTNLQVAFCTLVYLVGIAVFVTVIGIVSDLAQNLNITESAFIEKLDSVTDYINSRGLSPDLKKQILQYYQYLWKSRKGLDESKIIRELPDFLKIDVAMQLNAEIVKKVELFKSCSQNFIHEVVINLKPRIVMPGSYVIREGEPGNEMFFIGKGVVEVRSKTGQLWSTLGSGSFVGETALIDSVKRTANVISTEYVDLFVLEKHAFDEIMSTYPEDAKNVIATSEARKQMNKQKAALNSGIPFDKINKLLDSIGCSYVDIEGHDLFLSLATLLGEQRNIVQRHIEDYIRDKDHELQQHIKTEHKHESIDDYFDHLKKGQIKPGFNEIAAVAKNYQRTVVLAKPAAQGDDIGEFIVFDHHTGSKHETKEILDLFTNTQQYHNPIIIVSTGKEGGFLAATRKK
ncbi:hypothetical protein C9374_007294 [Naegleria lovaniensis]|uniref:Cyclic nucleotide-binding domain-containing protein n=1 Tax=Naegleria lovaniensis TaxID=51637 RepID=A0AA88H3B1_NAELO|nr:uncharacterized protein C9374_007294 [Naegleria lovaniensis]KAG2393763.1 hypothetical protein C9374_007294 [Naegleria lovaniensis]